MATYVQNYTAAQREFESLTAKRAATLKNIGKEQGLAKLTLLFKSGKTLEQRCADFDKLLAVPISATMTKSQAEALAKNVVTAHGKLNEGLKLNVAEFSKQATQIGPADAAMRTGFDVFVKRLEQLKHGSKMETENRLNQIKIFLNKAPAGNAKLVSDLKVCYLNIKKGCDETEALAKVAIARPSPESANALLSSSTGPRSINVGLTGWRQLIKADPTLNDKLIKIAGGDPIHILAPIAETTKARPATYWTTALKLDQPGWEGRLADQAKLMLKVVDHFRRIADGIKTLAKS